MTRFLIHVNFLIGKAFDSDGECGIDVCFVFNIFIQYR